MTMNIDRFKTLFDRINANVNSVIHGKQDVVRLALVAICANGHILFEDVPGVGKSMLARAISQSTNALTGRIQCTPDMLPGDITGSSIIDTAKSEFVFHRGPVFTNILLVDEVNRATPKTQSALLESMAERNVTVEGVTHPLPEPFIVLATQNPVEQAGTFPLPEAQLDRFLFKLTMGYPDLEAERLVVRGNAITLEVDELEPVCETQDILDMIRLAAQVQITEPVETFLLEIVQATRSDPALLLGASPRASIALIKASRALAAADGRTVVYPEDVKALLRPVLAHRLMLTPDAMLRNESIDMVLERVLSRAKPPAGVKGLAGVAKDLVVESSAPTEPAAPAPEGRRRRLAART
jgi:MoxR-like ATPase